MNVPLLLSNDSFDLEDNVYYITDDLIIDGVRDSNETGLAFSSDRPFPEGQRTEFLRVFGALRCGVVSAIAKAVPNKSLV